MDLRLLTLGAGQEVGKSCAILNVQGVNVMFDCGLHLGRKGEDRLPDFSVLGNQGAINSAVQVVVITHFHIDHIGALPYLTEVLGYRGPIVMTRATQALAQLMLEDYVSLSDGCGQSSPHSLILPATLSNNMKMNKCWFFGALMEPLATAVTPLSTGR
jgi:predicted metal-dependent RNase